jgi:phosphatidylglycerophosphatase C
VPQAESEELADANPSRAIHRAELTVYVCGVRTATLDELISVLEEHVVREPGGAIAFDGDGTLWSGDIGEDLFEALVEDGRFSLVAHVALAGEAEAHGIDATGSAASIAKRIHAAYRAETFPEERVCEIMAWAFAGWTKDDLDAFAATVVTKIGLDARLHAEAIRVVTWARERGVTTYLVSASPRGIVEQAARLVGIDVANVASATEERDAKGIVLASVVRPIPYGPGKVMHLRAKLAARPLYAAFGDNAFDVAMLRESRTPVAIRPKPRLIERAGEIPNLVVLQAPSY